MSDLIVSLQTLPPVQNLLDGCVLEAAKPWDREAILSWVRTHFGAGWAGEVACGLGQHPAKVLIVRRDAELLGFACFDVTFPGFFGPTGVSEKARGLGLGKALLVEAMHRLAGLGYVYAFIGDAGPVEFYRKTVGAEPVPPGLKGGYTPPLDADS